MVPETLDFLAAAATVVTSPGVITIQASVVGPSDASGLIEFHEKSGGRMRIARQNRQQPNSQRHPAWIGAHGFPTAPDKVRNKEEALPYFPEGGLRIYIALTVEGHCYAGFTAGLRPESVNPSSPMRDLYSQERVVGGVIFAD
jgi:hypothetical protein